jgi:hypothetical protein
MNRGETQIRMLHPLAFVCLALVMGCHEESFVGPSGKDTKAAEPANGTVTTSGDVQGSVHTSTGTSDVVLAPRSPIELYFNSSREIGAGIQGICDSSETAPPGAQFFSKDPTWEALENLSRPLLNSRLGSTMAQKFLSRDGLTGFASLFCEPNQSRDIQELRTVQVCAVSNPVLGRSTGSAETYQRISVCGEEVSDVISIGSFRSNATIRIKQENPSLRKELVFATYYQGSSLKKEQFIRIVRQHLKTKPKISFIYPKTEQCRDKFYDQRRDANRATPLAPIFYEPQSTFEDIAKEYQGKTYDLCEPGFASFLNDIK